MLRGDGFVLIDGMHPVGAPGALGPLDATQRSVKLPPEPSIVKLSHAGSEYVMLAPLAGGVAPSSAAPTRPAVNAVVLRRKANLISCALRGWQVAGLFQFLKCPSN